MAWLRRGWGSMLGACLLVLLAAPGAAGAVLPSGFAEALVASGISEPTAMAFAPDGRLFVSEKAGRLVIIKNGQLLTQSFVNLTSAVETTGERGLMGVAFDPNFADNGFVYVYYTAKSPIVHNRVSRFTANGDVAVPGSEAVLMDLESLSSSVHNGGALHFGVDGKLYVAVGENAVPSYAQVLSNRLGKLLRINADGSVPTDNPFYNSTSGSNRAIWALGLRNPFTFAVQPGTGRIFINDVGQDSWEEINEGAAGANYGWPTTEGATSNPSFRTPLLAYAHGTGGATTGCAITGGTFYNPPVVTFPVTYLGKYFYADLCSGWIRVYDPVGRTTAGFATGITNPVDLKVGADGALYYLRIGSGTTTGAVFRVAYTASQAPSISQHPASLTVPVGGTATFSVSASGTLPLAYQWQRNGADITGATAATYTIPAVGAGDDGATFRAVVTNAFGSATSNTATLTVTANTAPTGTISAPTASTLYNAGDTISYAGSATDAEDGSLPASAFAWKVDFHHDTHTHPFLDWASGTKTGTFQIPTTGETATNVWYRLYLRVTDSGGLTHTSFLDIRPRTVTLTLATVPPGLQVTLDGQPRTTPVDIPGVVGMVRTLGVVSPQTSGGSSYVFGAWSDGGAATHDISTPAASTTYTATYTTGSVACPCTIWGSTTTPAVAAYADPNAVELGVRFRSDVSGLVTGIRFYKGTGNTGTHVGNLWTSTGTLLARATFTNESTTGWQQVNFATPVPITANTTYVASYFAPVGRYAASAGYFGSGGVDAPPLHALPNSTGGNGVYRYSSTTVFPSQSYNGNNYWVDVVFVPGSFACPCTIWASTQTPGVPAYTDPNAVELGVKFRSDVSGLVTGIRFYKGTGNTGTHVGNLWTSTGTLLARATFTSESATGWQQVDFATPVPIAANTTYVASYFAPAGRYAASAGYFASGGIDVPPLHALPSSAGGNGVFRYSSTTVFPNQSYNGNNYWVDVVFTPQ